MFESLWKTLAVVLVAGRLASSTALPSNQHGWPKPDAPRTAVLINFNQDDLLEDNDGLPPHPLNPLPYGKPVWTVDSNGNGMEQHSAQIQFFEGKYYLYSETWACGRLLYFSGSIPSESRPANWSAGEWPTTPSGGECGFAMFSSDDLTHWRLHEIWRPRTISAVIAKPKVFYSAATKQYVLWFLSGHGLGTTGGILVSTGPTPVGPWSDLEVATGLHLSHDYDISVAPDGSHWIVTDPYAGSFDPRYPNTTLPLWDFWVQRLKADLTGTQESNTTAVQVMDAVPWEALGFFNHDGWWYITTGETCSNCESAIMYLRAPHPLGPWTNEAGETGLGNLKNGTILTSDGCTGQNKGVVTLPSPQGPVHLSSIWGYRSSPSNYVLDGFVAHADNSQVISSTFWEALEFDDGHWIKSFKCAPSVNIPLATEPRSVDEPISLQPDCRIRSGSAIYQEYPNGLKVSDGLFEVPILQRTDDFGPYLQDGYIMNGYLELTLSFTHGQKQKLRFSPEDISWAPEKLTIPVNPDREITEIKLSTNATNGCYGNLVRPRVTKQSSYRLSHVNGTAFAAPKGEIFIHALSKNRGIVDSW